MRDVIALLATLGLWASAMAFLFMVVHLRRKVRDLEECVRGSNYQPAPEPEVHEVDEKKGEAYTYEDPDFLSTHFVDGTAQENDRDPDEGLA